MRSLIVATLGAVVRSGCGPVESVKDNALEDRYYTHMPARTPKTAYLRGVKLDRHDGVDDNSPAARQDAEMAVDQMLLVNGIPTAIQSLGSWAGNGGERHDFQWTIDRCVR